jgi:hypothetical protein
MVMVISATRIVYVFGGGKFYEGGPRVLRLPMKWSTIAESLRNTALGLVQGAERQLGQAHVKMAE